jgi:hypothetical protein
MGGDPQTCFGTCMVQPQQVPELLTVAQCVMGNCADACM